jgi:hypothetical protein
MLHYRRHELRLPESPGLATVLARVFEALDAAGFAGAPVRVFLEDASSRPAGCERILSRFPSLQPLAARAPTRLSNLDGHWDAGTPRAAAESVPRETLLALAAGIPAEFALGSVGVLIGPLDWDGHTSPRQAALRPQPPGTASFSARFPAANYLAPGVIVQRLSTGTIGVTITELIAGPSQDAAVPPAIEGLLTALEAPAKLRVITVLPEHEVSGAPAPPPPDAAEIQARYRQRLGEIVSGLPLPHELPDPLAALHLGREPLGEIRKVIASSFAASGWKRSARRLPAGSHQLTKLTPEGRRLLLDFDTGSWSRHVVCLMALLTERGTRKLPVAAERSLRYQYSAPNRKVFGQILENLRVVVDHLEGTWIAELEQALGPVPEGYQPPEV